MTVRRPHRRVDLTADPRFNSNAFDAAALFGSQCAVSSQALDTTGLVAGMFDYLGLEELIDTYIGKAGSHVKVNCGAVTKALVMQLLSVPYQTLSGTVEFYKRRPLCALLNQDIMPEDLNRHVLSRYLDEVYELGAEKLFVLCARKAARKLDLKISEAHIDSTSFHYDGSEKDEEECSLRIAAGYSRDHRPDLPQVISLMISDGGSKLPLYQRAVSGNTHDNKSFWETLTQAWPLIIEQFKDLKYLVGDSALYSEENFIKAYENNIKIVTRVPDGTNLAKKCFAQALNAAGAMTDINPEAPDGVKCMWCEDAVVGGQNIRLLLIDNRNLKEQKTAAVQRRAQKEYEKLTQKLKKLSTDPCQCRKDAEKAVEKLLKSCKLCVLSGIGYEEVYKHTSRGRPRKGEPAPTVLACVKVTGKVMINENAVKATIAQETLYLIATNDTKREWTPAELLGTYKRQSVIERHWRLLKDPTLFLDALYLKTPHRITALLWVMSTALLVYSCLEYRVRGVMASKQLTIPDPEHKKEQNQPTLKRLFKYMENNNLSLNYVALTGRLHVSGLTQPLMQLLAALGIEIAKYYSPLQYEPYLDPYSGQDF